MGFNGGKAVGFSGSVWPVHLGVPSSEILVLERMRRIGEDRVSTNYGIFNLMFLRTNLILWRRTIVFNRDHSSSRFRGLRLRGSALGLGAMIVSSLSQWRDLSEALLCKVLRVSSSTCAVVLLSVLKGGGGDVEEDGSCS